MQNGFVTLKEALEIVHTRDRDGKPYPFNATVRTLNTQSKKGGKLIAYIGIKLLPEAKTNTTHVDTIFNIFDPLKTKRPPNHHANFTRNIELANGDIKKLKARYLITINGKQVIY